MTKYEGIPKSLTLDFAQAWVKPRVSEKRFVHIAGVASFAKQIANAAYVDPFLAELAGWLHDACKEIKAKQLVSMADEFGLAINSVERSHGSLIHGPIASFVCQQELGLSNKDVLSAIAEHTLGAVPMSDLSKVVFLADCLEEGRPSAYRQPILDALDMNGAVNLDNGMLVACDLGLKMLIAEGRTIHPRTVECRNYFLALLSKHD